MAVQQNKKKSPSKRGMHRAHDFLTNQDEIRRRLLSQKTDRRGHRH